MRHENLPGDEPDDAEADQMPTTEEPEPGAPDDTDDHDDESPPEPPHPINWNLLTAEDAEGEWLELNAWVNWLRHTYGLGINVIPPFWHRHPELVWELSALHLHWLCTYDPGQNGSAPSSWHRDFAETRQRLRDWVTASGTRLDRDRPTRQTAWPGEVPVVTVEDLVITNRDKDFVQFATNDVARRREADDAFFARLDDPDDYE
ncbi:hypothetical protein [Rathayibacter soli]|uniref:hypothetical protein n=1 Tax=Rathayibacter soli TaxID=3144168 RepID=UPI0027E3E07C|nr:hypothetical protein [Glaciibacter superstes]